MHTVTYLLSGLVCTYLCPPNEGGMEQVPDLERVCISTSQRDHIMPAPTSQAYTPISFLLSPFSILLPLKYVPSDDQRSVTPP